MDTKDTLVAFSEWLDGQGLIVSTDEGDERTHEELATAFIEHWETTDAPCTKRAPLAGREA